MVEVIISFKVSLQQVGYDGVAPGWTLYQQEVSLRDCDFDEIVELITGLFDMCCTRLVGSPGP